MNDSLIALGGKSGASKKWRLRHATNRFTLGLFGRLEGVDHTVHRADIKRVGGYADAANQLAGEIVGPSERAVAFAVRIKMTLVAGKNFAVP